MKLRHLFTFHGKLKRFEYATTGLLLVVVKYNIDRAIAYFGYHEIFYPTDYFNYFTDPDFYLLNTNFMYALAFTAVPFIAIGTMLTIKRLRDIGLPTWMVVFFFLPLLNLIFFALLSLLPSSAKNSAGKELTKEKWLDRFIPGSDNGSAAVSIVITSLLSLLAMAFCIFVLRGYGSSLFLGIPFVQGMMAAVIYGYHKPRTIGQCVAVACISIAMIVLMLLALAIEGILCLLMAAPLALIIAIVGAFVGYTIQKRKINASAAIFLIFGTLPLLSGAEYTSSKEASLRQVTSEIVINRSREEVWKQLVTFNEMKEPTELLFIAGIAYPIKAEIEGTGVGSVRKCWFTTGAFIEPIEVWDEPNLLKFSVSHVPPPLVELSFYNDLHLPHLEGYFSSEKGQFKLISLSKNKTLLQGTTWYRHKISPGFYWRLWSDHILHAIHYRVLDHIKLQTEKNWKEDISSKARR
jgi:uncharacterized membrane protein YhaH (DUF805 family)